jgi:hypothetical protein
LLFKGGSASGMLEEELFTAEIAKESREGRKEELEQ